MKDTEIIRTIQIDDKTVEVHIHLAEEEIRRLLLPLVAQAFADELRRNIGTHQPTYSNSTEYQR